MGGSYSGMSLDLLRRYRAALSQRGAAIAPKRVANASAGPVLGWLRTLERHDNDDARQAADRQ